MKQEKIHIDTRSRKPPALQWAQQELLACETIDDIKTVWNRFPCYHNTWQFRELASLIKQRIFYDRRKDT